MEGQRVGKGGCSDGNGDDSVHRFSWLCHHESDD